MAIDNNTLRGYGSWLQVTNLVLKAWMTSVKLWMDPFFRLLNHFITVWLRLEGNTLHSSPSFRE